MLSDYAPQDLHSISPADIASAGDLEEELQRAHETLKDLSKLPYTIHKTYSQLV